MNFRQRLSVAIFGFIFLSTLCFGLSTSKVNAACITPPTDKGKVTATVTVDSTAIYSVWARNRTTRSDRSGYFLQVDDECPIIVGNKSIPVDTWTWVNYENGDSGDLAKVRLTSGSHKIKLYGRDPSVQVDRLLFTQDENCQPTNFGDNCVGAVAPTTPDPPKTPTIDSSTDNNKPVNGTVHAGSDNPDTKTTIKIDGKTITSGYGMVSLDTSQLTNGVHEILVEKVNPDGSIEVIRRQVFVNNELSFWKASYNVLLEKVHYNKTIGNVLVFVASSLVSAAVAYILLKAWQRRVWETLPLINKIHIPALHNPHLFRQYFEQHSVGQSVAPDGTVVYGNLSTGNRLDVFTLHLGNRSLTVNIPALFFVGLFSLIGALVILQTFAASNTKTVDPENALLSGVSRKADTSAAGGEYIQFGSGVVATCPAGQTGTPPNCKTPVKQFESKCLARTGTIIRLSGARESAYTNKALKPNTIINAKGLTWDGRDSNGVPIPWVTTFGGDGPACWFGGKYQGVWNDTSPLVSWNNPYHHSGIATIRNPNFLIEGFRADNNGDGIRMEGNASGFHIRGVWMSNMHDDCVENDHMNGGTVEDSLFEGCYSGISSDHDSKTLDGSNKTVVFKDNLLWMKPMNTVFRGEAPGTAMLFKGWCNPPYCSPGPKMAIQNNIFRIDKKTGFEKHQIPPRMTLSSCSNNTIVWTGAGDFPYKSYFPSCFKITKDLSIWTNAVKKWKEEHANIF